MELRSSTQTESQPVHTSQYKLKLRPPKRNVKWSEDTVDNENLHKKKTKSNLYSVCCIYPKPAYEEDSLSSSSPEDINAYEYQASYRCSHKPSKKLKFSEFA